MLAIASHVTTHWPETVEQILGGDQAVMLAHKTPANGVVLTPVTNFAMQDAEAGTMAVNSSVAMWRKLDRMRKDPQVAIAFHTREHALTDRPEYVLVQGRASISDEPWYDAMGDNWERFGGLPPDVGPFWNWWLRAYHERVNVVIAVERMVVWPDLACRGAPQVHGAPVPPEAAAPQRPPGRGTGPRVDHAGAAKHAAKQPDVLLGWVGADGFPVVLPVEAEGSADTGMVLGAPQGLVPPGGRRAGLTAHWFNRYVHGQDQRRYTGWLESDGERLIYAPHTKAGYRFPSSTLAFKFAAGYGTRRAIRGARRAGFSA